MKLFTKHLQVIYQNEYKLVNQNNLAFQFSEFSQDINDIKYRYCFYDKDNYMPLLERSDNNIWIEVNYQHCTRAACEMCIQIRDNSPIQNQFPNGNIKNECM